MRRLMAFSILVAVVGILMPLSIGCASSSGPRFDQTRENQPHAFRNRIHNPEDYRYAER